MLSRFFPSKDFRPYSDGERLIYCYFDGMRLVHVDPIQKYREIMDVSVGLSIDMKVANSPSKDAARAHDKVIQTIQKLFALKPLDQGGLTDTEVVGLLDHFLGYCEDTRLLYREVCDVVDTLGGFQAFFRGRPSYRQFFGIWLNRKRIFYRRAGAVALGAGVALGAVEPGLDFYRAITDGEQEALLMQAQHQAARSKS